MTAPTINYRAQHLPTMPHTWPTNQIAETDYMAAVIDAITNHPRTLQKEIGPSEIGAPCARKIAYKLTDHKQRELPPNWRATVGTATHMWLEETFDTANQQWALQHGTPGVERYLIEERVTVGEHLDGTPIQGSCDLYDRATATVVDHKTATRSRLETFTKNGPPEVYRVQANLYGIGWIRAGFPVARVAICFLPRDGEFSDAYWWEEDFNPVIAAEALQRLHGIETAIRTLGNQAFNVLPTAEDYCHFCPFFLPGSTDPATGCPGHPVQGPTPTPTLTLSN